MYATYRYTRCTKCTKGMRKYKTDRRYPSQYGFHNRARSQQLAGNLSPWCDRTNIGEPALVVWPCWKLNSTLSQLVSPLILLTHDGLTYDRANSPALQATTFRDAHRWGIFISAKLLLAIYLITYVITNLCGCWPVSMITYVVYLYIRNIFRSDIYLWIVHLSKYDVLSSSSVT